MWLKKNFETLSINILFYRQGVKFIEISYHWILLLLIYY